MLKVDTSYIKEGLLVTLDGRLETSNCGFLQELLDRELKSIRRVIFDFEKLEYISSAGLRVLLQTQKRMNKQGSMELRNVSPEVKGVFEATGFTNILTFS